MLPWPPLQGRCVDGAPTLRIPSCADGLNGLVLDEREYKADRTSRDRRPHWHRPTANGTDLKAGGMDRRTSSQCQPLHTSQHDPLPPSLPRGVTPDPMPSAPSPARWSHAGAVGTAWTTFV